MIDISPYIDKLEALKEYMALSIHDRLPVNMMDYGISIEMAYNPALRPADILRLFNETGVLFYRGDYKHTESMRPPTFQEWYDSKQLPKPSLMERMVKPMESYLDTKRRLRRFF